MYRIDNEIKLLKLERETLLTKSKIDKLLIDIQVKRLNGDIYLLETYKREKNKRGRK